MYTFLLVILIIDAVLLIGVVLMQAGKGGGMAASFGGASSSADSIIGTRQAGNVLTRASWWLGGAFLALAFILQLMSSRPRTPESVLDRPLSGTPQQQAAPAPTGPAPAVPLEPAPTTPQGTQPPPAGRTP
ncbi:MAG TPA: preprotein translocase subunit SecG [Gemmatimonadaceae bacterium]|nr:preprotein translocase subunit SecG [Gemmatimonadaceae bacterium]